MSTLHDSYAFYSYWDVHGDGINPQHLVTYRSAVIFDTYNRTLYAYDGTFGNHQLGTYHGEIFNDFVNNSADGDYSSAHGYDVKALNDYEFGVGRHNKSVQGKTIFTVGDGTAENKHNILEARTDGTAYVNGHFYSEASTTDASYAKLSYEGVSYEGLSYVKNLVSYGDTNIYRQHVTHSYIESAYAGISYEGLAYVQDMTAYGVSRVNEQHVALTYQSNAYIETAYIENLVAYGQIDIPVTYIGEAYIGVSHTDEAHIDTSYQRVSYTDDLAYVGKNLWVDDVNVRFALSRMVRMFPISDQTPEGFYNGKHYIWVGTNIDLPRPEDRYANVIYIVVDEAPSTDLPAFNDDTIEDIVMADHGETSLIMMADDSNPERSDDRVLRFG